MEWRKLTIASNPEARLQAERIIMDAVEAGGFSEGAAFSVKLAMEEAVVNAMKHGNRFDKNKQVFLRYGFNDDAFHLVVQDEGSGFDHQHLPDPTDPEHLKLPYGRGIMLMHAYMDNVSYNANGNEVTLVKSDRSEETGETDATGETP